MSILPCPIIWNPALFFSYLFVLCLYLESQPTATITILLHLCMYIACFLHPLVLTLCISIFTNCKCFLDEDRDSDTHAYTVDRQYEAYWASAKANNYCCIMPVFNVNDEPLNPNHFSDKLIGAMCEVTFTLKHFTISRNTKPDGRVVEANDVFSAQVETVAILKHVAVIPRSPYKGRLTRRPHHRPQIPLRGEQINAANAFVPQLSESTSVSVVHTPTPDIVSIPVHTPTTITQSPRTPPINVTAVVAATASRIRPQGRIFI